ncbi:MAG: TolB family protein [Candidatus Limnocylindria bacterium]
MAVTEWGWVRMAWLVDLSSGERARLVARWDTVGESGGAEASVSADGRYLLAASVGAHGTSALHLVTVETGEIQVLRDETRAHAMQPRLSPAGQRFAFLRVVDGADDGLWSALVGEEPRRIAGPFGEPVEILGWSGDGELLAFRQGLDPSRVRVVPAAGGPIQDAGPGFYADWRDGDPDLLVSGSAGDGTYGIWTYSTTSGERREVGLGSRVADARWQPGGNLIAYLENAGPGQGTVLTRDLATGSIVRVDDGSGFLFDLFWSADGASLFARRGGDDSTTRIIDLLGRHPGVGLCLRGGGPPPEPCL